MDASEDVAALRADEHQATSCMDFATIQQIELSKRHWSELSKPIFDGILLEVVKKTRLNNKEVFTTRETHPEWNNSFGVFGDYSEIRRIVGSLELGEKFAKGVQAELFHARVTWCNPKINETDLEYGIEWVLKVIKEGTLVQDLQLQWPKGLFCYKDELIKRTKLGKPIGRRDICHERCATCVFVKKSCQSGMWLYCYVAEFESSIRVVGTGFWRVSEILQACRKRNIGKRLELFTSEVDIYSYGMTYYEVLSGKVPFEDHPLRDHCSLLTNLVIDQHLRLEVPDYVKDWARELQTNNKGDIGCPRS